MGMGGPPPAAGPVISVDIALVPLADLEDEPHIVARDAVERIGARGAGRR